MTDAPETLAELAWFEYESHRDTSMGDISTETVEQRLQRLQHARVVARNIRQVMAVLRRMGWPGRWPRELLITHRGRE